jgi:hypothetical protein
MSSSRSYDREVNVRAIVGFVLSLVVLMLVVAAIMFVASGRLKEHLAAQDPPPSPLPEANEPYTPPLPHLQSEPTADLAALRAEEDLVLSSYAWVDKDAGIVRVPIEEAMRRVARDGLPTWKPSEEAPQP